MRLRPIFGNAKMYYFTFKAVLRPKISIINNVLGFWLLFWWYVCHYICQRDSKWLLIIHYKKSLFSHHEKDLFVKSPTHTVSSTIFRKTTEVVALFNFYTVLRSHCAKHRLKFHETRQTSSEKKNWRTLTRRDAIHWLFQRMYSLSKEFKGLFLWVWLQNKKMAIYLKNLMTFLPFLYRKANFFILQSQLVNGNNLC